MSSIEEKVVSCGKIVFIDTMYKIEDEFEYLRQSYKNLTFFKSEVALQSQIGITIKFGGFNLARYISTYVNNGIYSREGVNKSKEYTQRCNRFTRDFSKSFLKTVKPMNIFGSIQTIFIIYAGCVLITLCCIGIELCWRRRVDICRKMFGPCFKMLMS
jgi:hypothetical protein